MFSPHRDSLTHSFRFVSLLFFTFTPPEQIRGIVHHVHVACLKEVICVSDGGGRELLLSRLVLSWNELVLVAIIRYYIAAPRTSYAHYFLVKLTCYDTVAGFAHPFLWWFMNLCVLCVCVVVAMSYDICLFLSYAPSVFLRLRISCANTFTWFINCNLVAWALHTFPSRIHRGRLPLLHFVFVSSISSFFCCPFEAYDMYSSAHSPTHNRSPLTINLEFIFSMRCEPTHTPLLTSHLRQWYWTVFPICWCRFSSIGASNSKLISRDTHSFACAHTQSTTIIDVDNGHRRFVIFHFDRPSSYSYSIRSFINILNIIVQLSEGGIRSTNTHKWNWIL